MGGTLSGGVDRGTRACPLSPVARQEHDPAFLERRTVYSLTLGCLSKYSARSVGAGTLVCSRSWKGAWHTGGVCVGVWGGRAHGVHGRVREQVGGGMRAGQEPGVGGGSL